MKNWIWNAQKILCAVAMFLAINSVWPMCQGIFYQPKEPKGLEKYKKLNK